MSDEQQNPFKFKFIPITERLSTEDEEKFSKNYVLSYVYLGSFKPVPNQSCATIQEINIESSEDIRSAVTFIEQNYYAKFKDQYSTESIHEFRTASESYFKIVNLAKLYRKEGKFVGCLLANQFDPYPPLGHATLHIGFAGYERDFVTRDEARFIKSCWVNHLNQISKPGIPIDASVGCFNVRSNWFFKSHGFTEVGYRLDSK